MKKIFLLALAGICGGGFATAQSNNEEKRVWFTDREYSTTGVTNDGIAVMYETWNSPYNIWNPRTGEIKEIGGVGPGNNVGGVGRFNDEAKTVSAVMRSEDIEVSTAWSKTAVEAAQGYTVHTISRCPENNDLLLAIATTEDNRKSLMFQSMNNGQTWKGDFCTVVPDPNVPGSTIDGWESGLVCMDWLASYMPVAGGHNGAFYISQTQGMQFNKADPHPAGNTDEVATYWDIEFLPETIDGYISKYGVIGLELTDGTGTVWYTEDGTDSFHEASGVEGVPMSIAHAGSRYLLVADNGLIQKSEDYGKTWTKVYEIVTVSPCTDDDKPLFTAIKFADDKHGIALAKGSVYVSLDGGENWVPVTVAAGTENVTWNDIAFDKNKATIAGTESNVYESLDMGETWSKVPAADDNTDYHAILEDERAINLGGENGMFFNRAYSGNVAGYTAAVYNMESGEWTPMPSTGYLAGEVASGAADISGDGFTIVGGAYNYEYFNDNSSMRYDAVAWINGEITILDNMFAALPGGSRSAKACKTSYDGSVIVGWQDHHGPWHGSVWRKNDKGVYEQSLMIADPSLTEDDVDMSDTPEGRLDMNSKLLGQCNAVSSDGKIIGGRGGTNYAVWGPWIWSEEKGLVLLDDTEYSDYMVYDMTNDGSFIVGQAGSGGSSFIWTEDTGFMEANMYVNTILGIDMQGYSICGIYDLSPNGRYITGWCMNGLSKYAYVLDLKGEKGLERDIAQTKAAVYPNPASDELHIDMPFDGLATEMTLYNMQGQAVLQAVTTENSNVMNVGSLPEGIYLLDVNANGSRKSFKLTIRH